MKSYTSLSEIVVECFSLGTLTGDVFMELQTIFQNAAADMGATSTNQIPQRALQILFDRGFIVHHTPVGKRIPDGVVPSERAYNGLTLELAHGGRCSEPRDAYDARLVAIVPQWAEYRSGLGVSVNTYQPERD